MKKFIVAGSLSIAAAVSAAAFPADVLQTAAVGQLTALADTADDTDKTDFADVKYNLLTDGTAEITAYPTADGKLVIPSQIDGKTVTAIGNSAFANSADITEISLPDTLTTVGDKAFYGCTALKEVTIPDSVTAIGNYAFGYEKSGGKTVKTADFVINCTSGSAAETYAKNGGLSYLLTDVSRPADITDLKTESNGTDFITISWTKIDGADGYYISRYNTASKKWQRVAELGSDENTYTDKNLTSGKTYKYAARAYTSAGTEKILASEKTATLVSTTRAAAVTDVKATATGTNSVKLTWKKSSGATSYAVYRYNTSTKKWSKLADTTDNTYTNSKLKSGTYYKYLVKASRTVSGETYASENSSAAAAVTSLNKVTSLKSAAKANSVKLSWSKVSGADGYTVYKYNSKSGKWAKVATTKKTAYTVSGLKSGTAYKYTVKAYKKVSGKTAESVSGKSVSAVTLLSKVSTLKSTATANSVKLSWSKVSGADGYTVYKYNSKSGKWAKIATTKKTAYTVSGLKSGTAYKYSVKAYKKVSGKTVASEVYKSISAATALNTPANVKSSSSASGVKLSWNKVSGADGYIVYKYDTSSKKWVKVKTVSATSYTVKNLKSATNYKLGVKAYKKVGKKTVLSQDFARVTTSTTPKAVSFSLKTGITQVTVKWNKVSGASGYLVYYKTDANGKWTLLKNFNSSVTEYTQTGLTKGKTYYFTVKAYKNSGKSSYIGESATKSAIPYYYMSATPTSVEKKAAAVLDSIASYNGVEVPSLYMAYCWCKMSYVSNIKEPSPGTAWFADFGLTHHYGNCYVMAATFTTFARLLGYDAVEISGEVPLVSGAIGPHSWVEIRTSQGTYVCDPDLESELGVNYYWIQYHQISAGSSYYIVGDGRHVKYHRLLVMN